MLENVSPNNIVIEFMRPQLSGFHDELFQIRCRCHIVYLIVKDGLDSVQDSINKIRQSIVYLSNNTSRIPLMSYWRMLWDTKMFYQRE